MLLAALDQAQRGGERGPRFIFPFLFLLLIGFLVARVIRHRRHGGGGSGSWSHHASPMQTLADRFARGEIDQTEYAHRKAVLDGDDIVPPAPKRPSQPAPADVGEGAAHDEE